MPIHVPTLSRACWLAAAVTLGASPVLAADLPAIKSGDGNAVPACATPGRMMGLLKARNAGLDQRFEAVATEYMRHGEALGIRWDYAFYQMILETGALSFKGDVKASQNNFAGLGATGKGERGESFADVSTGVRAHLEHLMLYAGEPVDNPVAERTRKVREWGVLTSWQKGLKKPITFRDLARKWAPWDKSYPSEIQSVAERFQSDHCGKADPRPELVAEARGGKSAAAVAETKSETRSIGADLARQALERARSEGGSTRSSLGAGLIAKAAAQPEATTTQPAAAPSTSTSARPAVTLLNPSKTDEDVKPDKPATVQTASAATTSRAGAAVAAPAAAEKAAPEGSQCRVWTASYGGAKAIIIKSSADKTTNYTVLDVNEGAEKREAQAYIEAYAKGGQVVGEFANPTAALDKAFDLCPE